MSYPVRVVVKESVNEVVRTGDELRLGLCDDPVLRKPGAADVLRAKLEEGGWSKDDDNPDIYRKEIEGGIRLIWDLDKQELTLEAEAETCIDREVEVVLRGDSYTREGREEQEAELRERGKEEVKQKLARELQAERGEKESELLDEVQEKLEAAVIEARKEVNDVLEGVYRDWLIQQANKLGKVIGQHESVSADGEVYELTIKIEE